MSADLSFLAVCIAEFRKTRSIADRCIEQLSDTELHTRINPFQNSVAVIMQHLAGNMLSRWSDFLTTDGEKPGREREQEFEEHRRSRAALLERWQKGWTALLTALEALTEADLRREVRIRKEPHSVAQAIIRQLAHYNVHLGQIQVIGKHLRGAEWEYISIPPGGSAEFNARMGMG